MSWFRRDRGSRARAPASATPAASPDDEALAGALAYHDATKHHFHRYADGPGWLDWANQPDPFRRWIGAELLPLAPAAAAGASAADAGPLYLDAFDEGHARPAPVDFASISRLFFDALAISAWKELGDARWALRVNPSSGNLHPTEAYLLSGAVPDLCREPAVFHYAPREHALELRARVPPSLWQGLTRELPPGALLIGFSSIHWREAWKYGARAWRYCQHDLGHALAAAAVSAAGLGWRARLLDGLSRDQLGALLGLSGQSGPEAEEPDALVALSPAEIDAVALPELAIQAFGSLDWRGRANDLSAEHVDWPAVDHAARVCAKPATDGSYAGARTARSAPLRLGAGAVPADATLHSIVRQRRSAVDMDGRTGMTRDAFARMLGAVLPARGRVPFETLPWRPRVHLLLFVHRVEGLEPGVYVLVREPGALERLRAAARSDVDWEPVELADGVVVHRLRAGDVRSTASSVSCHQDIAANGCFALGMIAELEPSLREHGPWFYPRLFWECGALGQVLYLEAEAAGLRSTGIGCFFDDAVHAVLGLRDHRFQSLYHFTVGAAVDDPRLTTRPAYPAPDEPT